MRASACSASKVTTGNESVITLVVRDTNLAEPVRRRNFHDQFHTRVSHAARRPALQRPRHPQTAPSSRRLATASRLDVGERRRRRRIPPLSRAGGRPGPLALARECARDFARRVALLRSPPPRAPEPPVDPHHLPLLGAPREFAARARLSAPLDPGRNGVRTARARRDLPVSY